MMYKNREHKGGINRNFFFEQLKNQLFGGKFSKGQVDGLNSLLDVWERDYAKNDDRWLAYSLGHPTTKSPSRCSQSTNAAARNVFSTCTTKMAADRKWRLHS